MKRPRPSISIGALSIFALALSPRQSMAAASASSSLPASREEGAAAAGVGDETGDGGAGDPQRKKAPVAKLSTRGRSRTAGEEDAPEIPLVGVGVGNLPHAKIPYLLAAALSIPSSSAKKKGGRVDEELANDYRLIDTSHSDSALEVLVGRSLSRLSSGGGGGDGLVSGARKDRDNVYHVMIKVWHTHLGYERTMLSVQDSLADILPARFSAKGRKKPAGSAAGTTTAPDVRVHAILQYPRCYDTLFSSPAYLESHAFAQKHSSCQEEEDSLPEAARMASGPAYSPLLDKEHAWKRSYRALEELYHHGTLESIGISSAFEAEDLADLFEMATVGPHVYQGTLETLLTDEATVEELVRRGVHYQCHDAASAVVRAKKSAPRAYTRLERIGARHGGMTREDDGDDGDAGSLGDGTDYGASYGYSPVQVALGWLVRHRGAGVVPGTTSEEHLAENAPRSLGGMPRFGPRDALDVEAALTALAEGRDVEEEDVRRDAAGGGKDLPQGTEEVIDADGFSYRVSTTKNDADPFGFDAGGANDGGGGGGGGVVATFFNTLPRNNVRIFHVHPESGEQIQISHSIPPGRSGRMIVNRDDVLIAYDGHGVAVKKFLVEELRNNGSVDFSVGA